MQIKGKTAVTGIFGYPVSHSLSPAMHNAAYGFCGLDYVYLPFEVSPIDLRYAVTALRAMNIRGVNITVPHKENVIPFLDRITAEARALGAVNLVCNASSSLVGDNTDWKGFLLDIEKDCGYRLKNRVCFICGAGGAAKSIVYALTKAGAEKIFIFDVIMKKAAALAEKAGCAVVKNAGQALKKAVSDADIVINASSVGMGQDDSRMPIPVECLGKKHFYYDVVYNRETAMIKYCRKHKIRCAPGLGMLLYQGAVTFEILTGRKAPVEIMRKALLGK